jgi:hypothetical protein
MGGPKGHTIVPLNEFEVPKGSIRLRFFHSDGSYVGQVTLREEA